MILRLEVPNSDPSLTGGQVKKWHKNIGDRIGFGEEVCTLAYSDFAVLRRTARATLLSGKKRSRIKGGVEAREGMVLVDVVLTSSDKGILKEIVKKEGEPFVVGDDLGVVVTDEDEVVQEGWADSPTMRITANMSSGPEQY